MRSFKLANMLFNEKSLLMMHWQIGNVLFMRNKEQMLLIWMTKQGFNTVLEIIICSLRP